MTGGVRQLPLDFQAPAAHGREDFLVSPANADAVAWIERWPGWPAPALVLSGPTGSGKSHLAAVWAARAGAPVHAFGQAVTAAPRALFAGGGLVLEDVDGALADAGAQEWLFHAYTHGADTGASLVLTASRPAARWGLGLADLASRLTACPQAKLGPPDDALLGGVLVKLFGDRRLAPGPEVIAYLLARIDRSLAAADRVVARIDRLSLAAKRPVTKLLVKQALESLGP